MSKKRKLLLFLSTSILSSMHS